MRARSLFALTLLAALVPLGAAPVGSAAAQVRRPLPVVQRIAPTSGPPGTTVTLHGRHFDPQQTVWLGARECEVTSRFPNRWQVRVPDGASAGAIEVRTSRGNVTGPRFRVTAAAPAPVIAGFAPAGGAAGTEVVIRGENFSARPAENQVHLGARAVVVRSSTPNELTVIIPSGAESAPFRVSVTGAGEGTSEASFAIGAGTSVASFEPAAGPPGTRVTIRGTGFHRSRARVRVYLGEERARVIRASETELTVEVPRRNATSARWLIDVRGGGRAYSEASFAVRLPPTVSAMTPSFGAPGTRVTLTGAHFGTDLRQVQATLGEAELTVRDIADDRLVLEIPSGATDGVIEVRVAGLGPARTAAFRVTAPVAVTRFAPVSGPVGTEVTITGAGFSADASHVSVRIGDRAAEVVRASVTELVVRIPAGPSGPLTVAVSNAGQVRLAQPFVVTTPPTITGFSPASGGPGTEVTIEGTNFGRRRGLVQASIGETRAEVRNANDGSLTIIVPANAQTGPIRITVRLQGSATSSAPFTVTR